MASADPQLFLDEDELRECCLDDSVHVRRKDFPGWWLWLDFVDAGQLVTQSIRLAEQRQCLEEDLARSHIGDLELHDSILWPCSISRRINSSSCRSTSTRAYTSAGWSDCWLQDGRGVNAKLTTASTTHNPTLIED